MKIKEYVATGYLSPSEGNPRNSEGSFLPLKDGRLAFVYSRYNGNSYHDDASCDLCAIYSYDNGASWDTEHIQTVVKASDYGVRNVMSVTLRRMNNGDIGLFYLVKHLQGTSSYLLRRYDEDFEHLIGETNCFPHGYDSYFVVNNDRVVQDKDGNWIVPAAYHHTSTHVKEVGEGYIDGRGVVYFFTSRDDGKTWTQNFQTLRLNDNYSRTGFQEPGLVLLDSGALYCYLRTDRMFQYEAVSLDGGQHWFGPQASPFTSPESPLLIKKNPYSGKYYAIWNPIPNYRLREESASKSSWGRTPYVIAESDDGLTFGEPVILEQEPTRGYCYPALHFTDDKTMLLAFCDGGEQENVTLNRVGLKKLVLE